jgi:Na+/H+ antiporter NhaD/arsenite permease-like protein
MSNAELALVDLAGLGPTLHPVSVVPFVALLLAIAILPLSHPHFWEAHRNKATVSALLAAPILVLLLRRDPTELIHTGLEYGSFIVLLGSLFTISGGIVLRGDLKATPATNTAFLALGAVLANLVGTTGASMLLIRPVLRTNSERRHIRHIPVFFIFLVSNIGGCLTPMGDPPLFLGYLRGVPFFWTLGLILPWLTAVAFVLAIFLAFEFRAYRRETGATLRLDAERVEAMRIQGKRNLGFLVAVVAAVFQEPPIREAMMVGAATLAHIVTPRENRRSNGFNFGPIAEVAILFAGIFVTMVPALHLLRAYAPRIGVTEPWQFFWLTGGLSSFLDNAPTYLTSLSLAQGLGLPAEVAGVPDSLLTAISLGAVFMGALSYIGNGPNFMVRTIAETSGFKMPSFFGYMAFAAMILLPTFLVVSLIYLR